MRILADGNEILNIATWQKNLLENDLFMVDTDEDLIRRLQWVINHKIDRCYKRLRDAWEPVFISEGAQSLPTDREAFVNMVIAHPKYKTKAQREAEYIAEMNAKGFNV